MSILDSQNIARKSKKKNLIVILLFLPVLIFVIYYFFKSNDDTEPEKEIVKKTKIVKKIFKSKFTQLESLREGISNLENRPDLKIMEGEISKDPLAKTIQDLGIDPNEVYRLTQSMKKGGYDFRTTRRGDKFTVKLDNLGKIWEFYIYPSELTFYYSYKDEDKLLTSKISKELKEEKVIISGIVKNSIYNSVVEKNEHPNLVIDLADNVFKGGMIDFFTDCQKDDKYVIITSKKYYENIRGEKVYTHYYGDIEAVVYKGLTTGLLYAFKHAPYEYYDEKGHAMKVPFLKYPFTFKVGISSGFGKRRDPVTRSFTRNHNGIDFPVRIGTPFIATAKGKVVRKAYQKNGAGKYIRLKHSNGYYTEYFHLSHINSNLRVGGTVKQGQILGKTGNTGRSTGPHLHYGMAKACSKCRRGFEYVNPLTQKFTIKTNPIPKGERQEYFKNIKPLKKILDKNLEKL